MRAPRRLSWLVVLVALPAFAPATVAEPADPTLALIQRADAFLHRAEVDGVARDPRSLGNPPEEIRLSVIPQLLAYCELYRIFPHTTAYRDVVDRADFLLIHQAEATAGSAFDGMLALAFLEAHAVTGDPRYRAAAAPYLARFRAMRGAEIRLNWGLMAAMALAEDARATGSVASLQKVHEILVGVGREQNRDGSFPHYCYGTRDVHYSAWMAMELILIAERVADPEIDRLLAGLDGFLSGRVDLAGATRYEETGPTGARAVFYSLGNGCPDYDTRGWTNELGYTALLFDRSRDPRVHGVLERLRELQDDGAFADKWGYPPGGDEPIAAWAGEPHSVIRTSVIFWSLASLYAARGTHVPVRYDEVASAPASPPDETAEEVAPGENGPVADEAPAAAAPEDEDLAWCVAREAPATAAIAAPLEEAAATTLAPEDEPGPRAAEPGAFAEPGTGAGPDEPAVFGLGPAYPNPAVHGCALTLRLPRAAEVRLRVFDGAGRRVRDLSQGLLGPGARTLRWDGRDEAGRPAAAGLYWLEVRAGAWRSRARLTIAR